MVNKWLEFHKMTAGSEARMTAVKAIDMFNGFKGTAIDLGCGSGRDTLYFLNKGWKVIAVDMETNFIQNVKDGLSPTEKDRLNIISSRFEEIELPAADLINSTFSLPYCKPKHFPGMWHKIVEALAFGGRFSGTLFGDRDDWANTMPERTFHTKEQVLKLFGDFDFEYFNEEEYDGDCVGENCEKLPKHWHVFQIIARKNRFIDLN